MEYVGEVLDRRRFRKRIEKYSDAKREHHYFMHVNHDMTIDATLEGNVTRCINHSCDPNAQTQKVMLIESTLFEAKLMFFQLISGL